MPFLSAGRIARGVPGALVVRRLLTTDIQPRFYPSGGGRVNGRGRRGAGGDGGRLGRRSGPDRERHPVGARPCAPARRDPGQPAPAGDGPLRGAAGRVPRRQPRTGPRGSRAARRRGARDRPPRRGAVVSALSPGEFLQAYQVREALETLAIRLAVPLLTDDDIAHLDHLVERQAEAVDDDRIDDFFALNSEFHELLRAGCRETRPCRTCTDSSWATWAAIDCPRSRFEERCAARWPSTAPSPARAARGDPGRAERLLRDHIRVPQRRLEATSSEEVVLEAMSLKFGVNLNNREPLIAPDYDLPDAARARRAGRGAGLRLGLGRRQPLLEAAVRADRAPLGDLAAHVAGRARHRLHGLLHPQSALPGARVGDARPALGRPDHPGHRHGQPGGGRAARVRGARAGLRQARRDLRGGAGRDPRSSGPTGASTSTASTSTTTTSRSTPAPRWGR